MELQQLRYWRELKGLTQLELAQKAGVAAATISRLESGQRGARPPTPRKLASVLEVEVEDLVNPVNLVSAEAIPDDADLGSKTGYPGPMGMARMRRQAKQHGPEWAVESFETLARSERGGIRRHLLQSTAREYRRKAAKDRGEYESDYSYLVERLTEEILFRDDARAALEALSERLGGLPSEVLDEVQRRTDYAQQAIHAYRHETNADQHT